ncbi:histidine kinase [Hwanghaeella grinnelliae]|uniref:Histidine kinase n=1 Tax=Hwanghaeella grinnelliae TaxID=2500179 RepID=A0A437QPS7_9PROT|nr:FIST C-terminal domain-containing protein [Hwanghaeella grinnelliae]RVU36541.1 histidine kinase [Hwanghaeella grinnelliae]
MTDEAPQTCPGTFLYGVGKHDDWRNALADIIIQLGPIESQHRLGVIYLTEHFQKDLADIEVFLRQTTGVPHWVGAVGYGICAGRTEVFGEPGAAVLLLPIPEDAFRVFNVKDGCGDCVDSVIAANSDWIDAAMLPLILTHGDPTMGDLPNHLKCLAQKSGGYLFGGLNAMPGACAQIADGVARKLSGVMLSPSKVAMQTGLSQGCCPIGECHRVTAAEGHVIFSLDGEPALEVLKRDVGPDLANDLQQISGHIFTALPVRGSDTGDYLVRNLIGIDLNHEIIAIGEAVNAGDDLIFCKRDPQSAVEDMERMLLDLKRRAGGKAIRGGIYISCAARGPNQFSRKNTEMDLIERHLGSFPIVGFFANGEINSDRLYGYTGVLAVFL